MSPPKKLPKICAQCALTTGICLTHRHRHHVAVKVLKKPLLAFRQIKSLQLKSVDTIIKKSIANSTPPMTINSSLEAVQCWRYCSITSSGRPLHMLKYESRGNLLSVLSCNIFSGSLNNVLLSQKS